MSWRKDKKELEEMSYEDICKSEVLKEAIKEDLARLFKENGLRGFERIQRFTVDSEMWSADNGLLTPTFKLIRKHLQNRYSQAIQDMYQN